MKRPCSKHKPNTKNSRALTEISRVQKVCWNLRWAFANTARSNSTKRPRVKIPIGTEEQNVDRALLDPAPVGQEMPRDFWAAKLQVIISRDISQIFADISLCRQFCQIWISWWFGTFLFFHILGILLPTDYLSDGLKPPTSLPLQVFCGFGLYGQEIYQAVGL